MEATFWDVLGIAATTDERAIKRAYAARLRITSPESDAAGYMKLRDAYEAAKRLAAMKRFELSQEFPPAEPLEEIDAPPAPAPVAIAEPPLSPQRQAFTELQALLSEQKFDDFLRKIEAIQASQVFATLDEQHDFIGEVAALVHKTGVEDVAWRGRLASLLGAREHDNIFAQHSYYWFAYQALLESYAEVRVAHTHAQAEGEDAATPGYLHVFHVLTAPFDSERLNALTRSSTYHRLAQSILERAKSDPDIVIPMENRDWWERTAMAGQHRPVEDPPAPANPGSGDRSSGFPIWPIWILVMLLFNGVRMCSNDVSSSYSSSSQYNSSEQLKRFNELMPQTESKLFRRMASCDPSIRVQIFSELAKGDARRATDNTGARPSDAPPPLDENDPVIASLLEKCKLPAP